MVLLAIDFISDRLSHREEHDHAVKMRDELLTLVYGASEFAFAVKEGGKPYIENSSIAYSITHTDGCISCAVSVEDTAADYPELPENVTKSGIYSLPADFPCEIGYDIEYMNERRSCDMIFGVSKKFFSEGELLRLNSSCDTHTEFFKIWTTKESLVKCTGEGMKAIAYVDVTSLDRSYAVHSFTAENGDKRFACCLCMKK